MPAHAQAAASRSLPWPRRAQPPLPPAGSKRRFTTIAATAPAIAAAARSRLGAPESASAPRDFDLELVAATPIHHPLELAALCRLLAAIRAVDPALRVRLWFQSPLCTADPFATLPADERCRLPEIAAASSMLAAIAEGGAVCVLLGEDAAWLPLLATLPAFCQAPLRHDFQWRLAAPDAPGRPPAPGGIARRTGRQPSPGAPTRPQWDVAARRFRAATLAVTPRWLTLDAAERAANNAAPPQPQPQRILVYQARSHLGDALWLTPLLRAARHRFPQAHIAVVAAAAQLPVLAANPHISELLVLPQVSPGPAPAPTAAAAAAAAAPTVATASAAAASTAAASAAAAAADGSSLLAIIADRQFDTALFALARRPSALWLAEAAAALGIPRRINLEYFDRPGDGRNASPLFTHEAWFFWGSLPSPRLLLHALDPLTADAAAALAPLTPPTSSAPSPPSATSNAATAAPAPGPATDPRPRRADLPLSAAWRHAAAQVLADTGIAAGQAFAILAPGARSSTRWPPRKFAALAARLAAEWGLHVLIEAAPAERDILRQIEAWLRRPPAGSVPASSPLLPLPPPLSPAQRIFVRHDSFGALAALLERATLLVANDSSPIHLAALSATPTLYLAQREKLIHSHPEVPTCRALYDAARNRPARLAVSDVWSALQAMADDGLIPPAAPATATATAASTAAAAPASPRRRCASSFGMLHFVQQIDRLHLPVNGFPADATAARARRQARANGESQDEGG